MRNYYIEDIADQDIDSFEKKMLALQMNGSIEGIFYLPLPEKLLTQEQQAHQNECGPYYLSLEVLRDLAGNVLKMELLVRAHSKIRCSCVAYCTPAQRNHMIDYLDELLESFDIKV